MNALRLSQRQSRRLSLKLHALRRHLHEPVSSHRILLQSHASHNIRQDRKRSWPFGASSLHNLPAIRAISFARAMPKLALKLARIPAMFGGAMIAAVAYIQYQAIRRSQESGNVETQS